jgi:hypothetical protein
MKLFVCGGCARHVRDSATVCPFCRQAAPTTRSHDQIVRRVSRAVMLASAGLLVADCSSSNTPFYGACPPDSIDISAACGFQSVTTTCAGATATFVGNDCTVAPIAGDCSIVVVLGDGTSHTIAVIVTTCPYGNDTLSASPGVTDLSSTTCGASDAGNPFADH